MALLQYDRLEMGQPRGYGGEAGFVAVVGSETGGNAYVRSADVVDIAVDFWVELPGRADVNVDEVVVV